MVLAHGPKSSYKSAHSGFIMSALANRDFVKMNGLGNEIVIVDLRRAPGARSRRRGARGGAQEPYDQLMALYPGAARSTRPFASTTMTGRRRAPAATACAAWPSLVSGETGKAKLNFETPPASSPAGAR
jgi:diaminopimelate epimerase